MKIQPILSNVAGNEEVVGWAFYCPGCRSHHAPYVKPHANPKGASWSFNGDVDRPTFNPSILTRVERGNRSQDPDRPNKSQDLVCHLFVKDGIIEYLSDCTHELARQTIEMEEIF